MTQGEDENGGGREENPSGENNLGPWDENGKGSHKIEDDLFSSIFEPVEKYDMPTHGVNDGDIHEEAETGAGDVEVKEDGDEIDGDEDEEDGDEAGGVGDEKEGEKETHIGETGGEEEENIDLENLNNHSGIPVKEELGKEAIKELILKNHFGITVKEEEKKKAVKELALQEASLLSLFSSGLATSGNILSSLTPLLQVFAHFHKNIFCQYLISNVEFINTILKIFKPR